jgi:hypothetical protein
MKLHKSIKDLMEKKYYLNEVSYDDDLSNNLSAIENAIQDGSWLPLDNIVERFDATPLIDAAENLCHVISEEFSVSFERAERFYNKYYELIDEEIMNRDASTPLLDLINHTGEQIFYYNLGSNDDDNYVVGNYSAVDYDESVKTIKGCLGIAEDDIAYDEQINRLIIDACGGGRLQVFWSDNVEKYLPQEKEYTTITFTNPMIAVVDRWNGSGSECQFKGITIKIPVVWENINLDLCHKYSYTDDICGMRHNWCDCTQVHMTKEDQ